MVTPDSLGTMNLSIRVFNRNTSFHDFNADRIDSSTTEPFLDRVVTRSSYHGTRVNKDQSIDLNYSRPSFTTAPPTSPISIISSNNHKDSNERLQMIKPHELNIINGGILGRGEFGEVYKGIWQDQDVAVKILKDSNPTTVKLAIIWEIFTYGRTPYEDENIKSVAQLIKFLQEDGSRLSQPEDCCIDTFSAMLLCWMKEQERANISIIRAEFEKIYLTKTSKNDPMAYHVSLASNLYDTP
uniref:Tyrosine-protein kinase catalytic domain-containing protein n=1 Tax=Acrobeloides nanus TaxID=290746 RepID=A0A914D925_9BILA